MDLIDRINLILDGEPLDGVGDNPDVLNRPIKQLIEILESGDQSSITVQNLNIKVESTDFEPTVETGDFVYLNKTTHKYTKANVENAKYIIGIADLEKLIINTTGIQSYTGLQSFEVGKIVYLDSVNDGAFVLEGSEDASTYALGLAITDDTILFKSSGGVDIDSLTFGDVTKVGVETLTNKTLNSLTNTIVSDKRHLKVSNRSTTPMYKGQVVSLQGWDSGFECPRVILSKNSLFNKPAIGILNNDIPINSSGEVIVSGIFEGFNTSSYAEGETLYVGLTNGAITNTKPSSNSQIIGRVVLSDTNDGQIYLSVGGEESFFDLTDYETIAPILSGDTSGNENTTIDITIDNFDPDIDEYTITVTSGSFTRVDDVITWTLPDVSADTVHQINVEAKRLGELKSSTTTHLVTVNYVAIANPVLSGPDSGNELQDIAITIDNYDAGNTYNIAVTGGTFVRVDDVITWTLPDVTVTGNYQINVQAQNINGTSAYTSKIVNVILVPVDAPILSGVSTANESSTIPITIDNYDAGAISYNINTTAGTTNKINNIIYWTLPDVTVDTNHTISVSVTTNDGTSSITNKVVNVLDVPVTGDANIVLTDYETNASFNDGFDYL